MASENLSEAQGKLASLLWASRKKAAFSQAEFAGRTGLSVSKIGRIERGEQEPTFDDLGRWIAGLGDDGGEVGAMVLQLVAQTLGFHRADVISEAGRISWRRRAGYLHVVADELEHSGTPLSEHAGEIRDIARRLGLRLRQPVLVVDESREP